MYMNVHRASAVRVASSIHGRL